MSTIYQTLSSAFASLRHQIISFIPTKPLLNEGNEITYREKSDTILWAMLHGAIIGIMLAALVWTCCSICGQQYLIKQLVKKPEHEVLAWIRMHRRYLNNQNRPSNIGRADDEDWAWDYDSACEVEDWRVVFRCNGIGDEWLAENVLNQRWTF